VTLEIAAHVAAKKPVREVKRYGLAMQRRPGARGRSAERHTRGRARAALITVMALVILGASACSSPQVRPGHATKTTTTTTVKSVQLQWSAPDQIDANQNGLGDVSCASASFCVAVGSTGPGVVSSAFIWNGTSWSATAPQLFAQDTAGYNHISCPTVSFCLAGAPDGGALIWNGTSWSAGSQIRWPDPNDGITNVSCATASFCLAGDEDGDIRVWDGTSWSIDHQVVPGSTSGGAHAVSCASASFCVAVNDLGNAIAWNGSSLLAPDDIDGSNHLVAVSCPLANFCMALDSSSYDWIVWNGTSWSTPQPIGTLNPGPTPGFINWVSCPTATFCVAVVSDGNVIVWSGTSWSTPQPIDPNLASARGPAATSSNGHPSLGMKSVSCPTATFCVAVGSDGDVVMGRMAG